jgi:hypothetical protein
MANEQTGDTVLQGTNTAMAVKGFANKLFKLGQILAKVSSSDFTEKYFREDAASLTAAGNRDNSNIAKGALFPQVYPNWTEVTGVNRKFGNDGIVYIEDNLMASIPVQRRTIFKVAQAIADAKDLYTYTQLTAATGTSGVVAAADAWNSLTEANRDSIGDLLLGQAAIGENNYDPRVNTFLLLNELDWSSLMRDDRVIKNPSFKSADVVTNGRVGQILSMQIIVSNSVSADEAMIVIGNVAATWQSVSPLKTITKPEEGISVTIRSWEIGHIQITDPQALYTVTGTQK